MADIIPFPTDNQKNDGEHYRVASIQPVVKQGLLILSLQMRGQKDYLVVGLDASSNMANEVEVGNIVSVTFRSEEINFTYNNMRHNISMIDIRRIVAKKDFPPQPRP